MNVCTFSKLILCSNKLMLDNLVELNWVKTRKQINSLDYRIIKINKEQNEEKCGNDWKAKRRKIRVYNLRAS